MFGHELPTCEHRLTKLARHQGLLTVQLNVGLHAHCALFETPIALLTGTVNTVNLLVVLNLAQGLYLRTAREVLAANLSILVNLCERFITLG